MNSGSLARLYGLNHGPINGSRKPSVLGLFINATCAVESGRPGPQRRYTSGFQSLLNFFGPPDIFLSVISVTRFSVSSKKQVARIWEGKKRIAYSPKPATKKCNN